MVAQAHFELFNVEFGWLRKRNVEFCNRLCRLPEQEWLPEAMLNCRILNYYGLNQIYLANNVYLCNR